VERVTRALSLFAGDVSLDMDENRQWRISIEEKIDRILGEC
jgi:hypothetical protein